MTKTVQSERGFTMVELVIAVIIIAILVAITVPILQERAAQAKLAAARADLENIAAAMERAALDTGYMFRLFVLDDIPGPGDGVADPRVGQDAFGEEIPRTVLQDVSASNFFIDVKTGEFVDDANLADNLFERMSAETAYDVAVSTVWNGPYITWNRDTEVDVATLKGDDIPNDPWGNNYVLFTKAGVIWEPAPDASGNPGTPAPSNTTLDQPVQVGAVSYPVRRFDRPTVLSMGPDGLPGGDAQRVLGEGDDLYRHW